MELLLILSALLTGLTGAFSGDGVQGRPQLQAAGVEAAAVVAVDQLAEAAVSGLSPHIGDAPRRPGRQAVLPSSGDRAIFPAVIGISERRRE